MLLLRPHAGNRATSLKDIHNDRTDPFPTELMKLPANLRVLVTSHPLDDIQSKFIWLFITIASSHRSMTFSMRSCENLLFSLHPQQECLPAHSNVAASTKGRRQSEADLYAVHSLIINQFFNVTVILTCVLRSHNPVVLSLV